MARKVKQTRRTATVDLLESRRLLSITLNPETGVVELLGNSGNNAYTVSVNADQLVIQGKRNSASYDLASVRQIRFFGYDGNDSLRVGSTVAVPVYGVGGTGTDTLVGGSGDDILYGNGRGDLLIGNGGSDHLYGAGGGDRILGGGGLDTIDGGAGIDVISTGQNSDNVVSGSLDIVDTGSAASVSRPVQSDYRSNTFQQNVSGFDPNQIRNAYNFSSLDSGSNFGDGQTVYIVDAFNGQDVRGDLARFSEQFGLLAPTAARFQIVYASGAEPAVDEGWAVEIALDVQWVHALAPRAHIVLVEADSAAGFDMLAATRVAADMAQANGGGVVSMSFGTVRQDSLPADVASWESVFSSHPQVTFVAASGDDGGALIHPATSPYVTAVGGTDLTNVLDQDGVRTGDEPAWAGSGGGETANFPVPAYQQNVFLRNAAGAPTRYLSSRGVPDVAFNAVGFAVYNSTPDFGDTGWFSVSGTSASAPAWAALIASMNQVRKANGLGVIGNQLNGMLYEMYQVNYNSSGLSDIMTGVASSLLGTHAATEGYDLATGLGVPDAQTLIRNVGSFEPFYFQGRFNFESTLYLARNTLAIGGGGTTGGGGGTGTGSSLLLDVYAGEQRSGWGNAEGAGTVNFDFVAGESSWWIRDRTGFNAGALDQYNVQLYRTKNATKTGGRIYGVGTARIVNNEPNAEFAFSSMTFLLNFEGTWSLGTDGKTHFSVSFNAVDPITKAPIPQSPFQRDYFSGPYQGEWFGGSMNG